MSDSIAIIVAMDEEMEGVAKRLSCRAEQPLPFSDRPLLKGYLGDQTVAIIRSGIGKVNAALAAQYLIDHFSLKAIINSGLAGALSPKVKTGDLVISSQSQQHDIEVGSSGWPRGCIPRLALSKFPSDPDLGDKAARIGAKILSPANIHRGLIVSGDQFIASVKEKKEILSHFPQALCVEMEGAAIAHVAYLNSIPHLILRIMSDQADDSAAADLEFNLTATVAVLGEVVCNLVREL